MSWNKLEEQANKGPIPAAFAIFGTLAAVILIGWLLLGPVFGLIGTANQGAKVLNDEIGPAAMQAKYNNFKNLSAALDAQAANIDAQDRKIKSMIDRLGEDATKWPEDAAARVDKAETERSGMVMNYNKMAASYNADMAKWWTRFMNKGMLPEGATDAPKKEYREYK